MNLRAVKKKTKSVTNVRKITKAMQLVSAFKMKKAQQMAIEGKPFQSHLEQIIDKVVQRIDPSYSILINRPVKMSVAKRDLAILISSNKGLCGSFNFNLFNLVFKKVDFKNTDFIVVGKKGALLVYKLGEKIIADFSSSSPLSSVSAIFNLVLEQYLAGNYTNIFIIYNRFISTLKFEPTKQIILPLMYKKEIIESTINWPQYLIEPSAKEIIDPLLRSYIEEKIRFAIIESEASEHSSRMMAMKNATDNANDVIYNLTLLGNKLRQEKITGELLDMITAKESVENN